MYIELLKEMFKKMVLEKDASLIPNYYHKDFLLYTNGGEMDYQTFLDEHVKYYATSIQYQVKYHEESLIEQGDKVSGRMWITTSKPGETDKEIEVMLVAFYRDKKLHRVWELTYPDWSNLPEFKNH